MRGWSKRCNLVGVQEILCVMVRVVGAARNVMGEEEMVSYGKKEA